MKATESYIDSCAAAASLIDVDVLSAYELGDTVGRQGGEYITRTLGIISLQGAEIHSGVKLPIKGDRVETRTQIELEAIELLLGRMPELADQVPQFIMMLTVDGSKPVAQLIEDASCGGQFRVRPITYNTSLAESIMTAFSRRTDLDIEVDEDVAEHSLSFLVGDRQRLLDFTPPPIRDTRFRTPLSDRLYDLVYEGQALHVDIDAQSRLGQSLVLAKAR